MTVKLTDRVAIVTGAAQGMGAATAQKLAERILERHARTTDDALAAVVRFLGS